MWSHPAVPYVLGVLGLASGGGVVGFFVWWHRAQIAQAASLGTLHTGIAELRVALMGPDGRNGIRGEVAKLAARDEEVLGILRRNTDLTHEFVGRVTITEDRIATLRLEHNELRADFRAHITGHGAPPSAPLLDRRAS